MIIYKKIKQLLMKYRFNPIFLWVFVFSYLMIAYIIFTTLLQHLPSVLFVALSTDEIFVITLINIFCISKIYILLKKENIIKAKVSKNLKIIWITTKLEKVSFIIQRLWINFYHTFIRNSFKLNILLVHIAKFFGYKLTDSISWSILIIFEILPKLILVIAFLVDIYYFKTLFYFYKCLLLLLLPLFFKTISAILARFSEDNCEAMLDCVDMSEDASGNPVIRFKEDFTPAKYIRDLTDFIENHLCPIILIAEKIERFSEIIKKYKINWLFIGIWILYIIGWSTILYFGIFTP